MRDLSLHLLDLAQNSIAAGAARIVLRGREEPEGRLIVAVEDDGQGMAEQEAARVKDPFYTTKAAKRIGLGLPLFCQAAELTGGWCAVFSRPMVGTQVFAVFHTAHINMAPLGDLAATFIALVCGNPLVDFRLVWEKKGKCAVLDTLPMRPVLEEIPLNTPDVLNWMRSYWKGQLSGLE